MESSTPEPPSVEDQTELLSLLDEELNRLPQHFRAALVACELQGKSRREAAVELKVVPEMPGGRLNEPLDVGTITARLFDTLEVGDLAADFDLERIGSSAKGGRLKLSDHRGKLVLLSFWDFSAGSKDMVAIKEIHDTFGRDPRFEIISLFVGPCAEPADTYVKLNAFPWSNGFADNFGGDVARRYKVDGIPHRYAITRDGRRRWIPLTFLIAPDGRFLAHDVKGDDLEIVRKSLANENLFSPATKDRTF